MNKYHSSRFSHCQASKIANGNWITILNADDYFTNIYICELVIKTIKSNRDISVLYGDVCFINPISNRINRYWKSSSFSPGVFKIGWSPPHPGFFYKKKLLTNILGYCESMKIAADVEFMYRLLETYGCKSYYIPTPLVQMRSGGLSGGIKSKILLNLEIIRFLRASPENLKLFRFLLNKFFFKGLQYFRRDF